ncbi:MAG: hypothetical protein ABIT38_22175, partial [Gemmatimonadaceae bacterium]
TLGPAGRLVIGVAGESGSGKSITAASLAQTLNGRGVSTTTIHQDDYFILPPRTNHEQRLIDLAHVGPHEVDLARIRAHIAAFRQGRDVNDAPLVDYPSNRFIVQTLHLAGCDVLVVEGTYVLNLPEIDVRVFLEATHEDSRQRRRERNRDIDHPVIDAILGIEHDIIAPQREHAHIVIDRHFAIHRVA